MAITAEQLAQILASVQQASDARQQTMMLQMSQHHDEQRRLMLDELRTIRERDENKKLLRNLKDPDVLDDNITSTKVSFEDWRFKLMIWLSSKYAGVEAVVQLLETCDQILDTDVSDFTALTGDVEEMNKTLITYFGLYTKGHAAGIAQLVLSSQSVLVGFETLRRMMREFGDLVGNHGALAALRRFLRQTATPVHALRAKIESVDRLYVIITRRLAITLPDVLRQAVLLDILSEPVLTHVTLQLRVLDTYEKMRKETLSYLEHLHESQLSSGAKPMDVSSVEAPLVVEDVPRPIQQWICSVGVDPAVFIASLQQHRKGKGKGKGFTSSQSSSSPSYKSCHHCKGPHDSDTCWTKFPWLRPEKGGKKQSGGDKGSSSSSWRSSSSSSSSYSKGKGKGGGGGRWVVTRKGKGKGLSSVEEDEDWMDESKYLWTFEESKEEEEEKEADEEQESYDTSAVELASFSVVDDVVDAVDLASFFVEGDVVDVLSLKAETPSRGAGSVSLQPVDLTLDSAAAACVCGVGDFPDVSITPLVKSPIRFRTADGTIVDEVGTKRVVFVYNRKPLAIVFHVACVHKPLVSLDALVMKKHMAVLREHGSFLRLQNGQRIAVWRHRGVFGCSLHQAVKYSSVLAIDRPSS